MPLHLLPKKSWNVYAPANIERVKRDEAEARRKAVEEEKQGLQNQADDRLQVLKQQSHQETKSLKRKLPGEDDTDRDIRLALENAPSFTPTSKSKQDRGSVVDADGHSPLIPAPQKKPRLEKNQNNEEYTVYLTDATGRGQQSKNTWYTSLEPPKEIWSDHNPRRQEREAARLNAIDPLAAMKKGVNTLRENEMARREWMQQRERDLQEVEKLARKHKHERKHRKKKEGKYDEHDSLDEFNLDDVYTRSKDLENEHDPNKEHERRHRHRHRHRRHDRQLRHRHTRHDTDGTGDFP